MLAREKTVLTVIDVQGKLAELMHDKASLFENLEKMIRGAKILELPILWTEQAPEKLGPTVPPIAELMEDIIPLAKNSFSCCGCAAFVESLRALGRFEVLLTGIEAHICVYQTAVQLLNRKCRVEVIADAVSSRSLQDKQIALDRMRNKGAGVMSTEMVLFELLGVAEGSQFRHVLDLVK